MLHTLFENETADDSIESFSIPQNDVSKAGANNDILFSIGTVDHAVSKGSEIKTLSGRRGPRPSSTFPAKLHKILSHSEFRHIIMWTPNGSSWRVLQPKLFEETVMPKYFSQQSKYSSFTRQVNGWGFKRITQGEDRNCYYHPLFKANMPHLTRRMRRLSVLTSKKKIENSMKKSPRACEREESQIHRSDRPDYPKSQYQEYSHRSQIEPQFHQDSHQNKCYYNTQESPQALHSNVSHNNNFYYDGMYNQKPANDGTYQHSYHDPYRFSGQDYYGYQNFRTSSNQQEYHHGTFNESDQYNYHQYYQYHQENYHNDDVKQN